VAKLLVALWRWRRKTSASYTVFTANTEYWFHSCDEWSLIRYGTELNRGHEATDHREALMIDTLSCDSDLTLGKLVGCSKSL